MHNETPTHPQTYDHEHTHTHTHTSDVSSSHLFEFPLGDLVVIVMQEVGSNGGGFLLHFRGDHFLLDELCRYQVKLDVFQLKQNQPCMNTKWWDGGSTGGVRVTLVW